MFSKIISTILTIFTILMIFITEGIIEPVIINMSEYKRKFRELDSETKNKISKSSKNKPKSEIHKQHISQSLTRYWLSVPNRPSDNTPSVTNGDIV